LARFRLLSSQSELPIINFVHPLARDLLFGSSGLSPLIHPFYDIRREDIGTFGDSLRKLHMNTAVYNVRVVGMAGTGGQ
jgi:hypothetical protein